MYDVCMMCVCGVVWVCNNICTTAIVIVDRIINILICERIKN